MFLVADNGEAVQVQYLGVVISVFLPIVVALITKVTTSGGLKAILLAFLTGLSGFLTEWGYSGDDFNWKTALVTWGTGWAIAVATHYGLWKPTQITAAAQSKGNT